MWRNNFKDYPPDEEWIHEKVESGKGIIGCEMHEINGWQERQENEKTLQERADERPQLDV